MLVRRDLGRSSSPSSWATQKRVSYEVGTGYLRLYPDWPWKCPRIKTAQPLRAAWSTAWLSSWWKSVSLYPVWISVVSIYAHCLLSCWHTPLWKACFHLLDDLLGFRRLLLGVCPTPSLLLCRLNKFHSLSLSSQGKYSSPLTVLVALSRICSSLSISFLH